MLSAKTVFEIPEMVEIAWSKVGLICLSLTLMREGVCRHSINCCFDSGVIWNNHALSPVTMTQHAIPFFLAKKSNEMAKLFSLCSAVSIPPRTQFLKVGLQSQFCTPPTKKRREIPMKEWLS
ncbi:hypothetical protein TNCV_803551 [Trichonephila clavipes]|nr:hypothetical protein TNCV_803551 [Trichonephila clavipes]